MIHRPARRCRSTSDTSATRGDREQELTACVASLRVSRTAFPRFARNGPRVARNTHSIPRRDMYLARAQAPTRLRTSRTERLTAIKLADRRAFSARRAGHHAEAKDDGRCQRRNLSVRGSPDPYSVHYHAWRHIGLHVQPKIGREARSSVCTIDRLASPKRDPSVRAPAGLPALSRCSPENERSPSARLT